MGVEDAVIELYHIKKIQNQLQPMKCRFKFLLIYIFLNFICLFWLCWVSAAARAFLYWWWAGGCSLVAVHRLQCTFEFTSVNSVASFVAEHWALGCVGFSRGFWALEHRLNGCGTRGYFSMAYGIFPDQWLKHWHVGSLPLSHEGSPNFCFYAACLCVLRGVKSV